MSATQLHEHDHHDHQHPHSHSHDPAMPALGEEGPPQGGPVVVDIGDDVGALIAHMDAGLVGQELFLRPETDPSTTTHTGIWERPMGQAQAVVAVFPMLVEGRYEILDGHGHAVRDVTVVGGVVTEIDLRTD